MLNKKVISLIIVTVFVAAGCETMSQETKKGATIGGIVGAAAGGIAGHQDGKGWEGALIGGAAGSVLGGIIGSHNEKQKASNSSHLSVVRIVEMTQDGVPDEVIISEIKRTKSKYELSADIITYLKDNNVSDDVIDVILATS